ncbi:HEAT repeat domain-containing protein [Bremerella cremea]|uniref:HEAT repeat domain-containing protein n=1 Tax=Bremerella cremea TaxID=1031537 RepID=A0A368KLX3_9BACT|nr:HEAT repeat domain-containing protein [Bremerella cremea]RCS42187.1 HEAT repeat domain-containing protein [Bremerella cremea]
MDHKSTLRGIYLVFILGIAGCASNGAIVDPLIYWDKDDAEVLAKYGPTPTQRIQSLDSLANRAGSLTSVERTTQSTKLSQDLATEPNSVIRVHMVRTLAKMNTPEAFAGLKSSLYDNDEFVRREAVTAMGTMKNPEAIALLGDVLIRDRDYDVRLTAAKSLGEFNSDAAHSALVPALDARDPAMRFAAIESLRKSSKVDYKGDTAKWREFAQGGNPEPPATSIAEQLIPSFLR